MMLAFKAKFVRCSSAIGGEILQVYFDTLPAGADEETRTTPSVLIGQNFEFPGPATIDWHDGSDYGGGANIVGVTLARDRALIKLKGNMEIDVSFCIGNRRFAQLMSYLRRMLGEAVFAPAPNKPDRANRRQPLGSRKRVDEADIMGLTAAVAHPERSPR